MTIDEAIKSLSEQIHLFRAHLNPDLKDAVKLGIEALKAWKSSRDFTSIHQVPLLQGETTH